MSDHDNSPLLHGHHDNSLPIIHCLLHGHHASHWSDLKVWQDALPPCQVRIIHCLLHSHHASHWSDLKVWQDALPLCQIRIIHCLLRGQHAFPWSDLKAEDLKALPPCQIWIIHCNIYDHNASLRDNLKVEHFLFLKILVPYPVPPGCTYDAILYISFHFLSIESSALREWGLNPVLAQLMSCCKLILGAKYTELVWPTSLLFLLVLM